MYDKFQGCTVDVQVATMILSTLQQTLGYLCTLNVFYDVLCDDSVEHGRFQSGTVNVHAHAFN